MLHSVAVDLKLSQPIVQVGGGIAWGKDCVPANFLSLQIKCFSSHFLLPQNMKKSQF
jgi:hypothetical protein